MIIDFAFIALIALAAWKGYNKGLIVAVFSLIAFIVGLAAAVKFSAVVAGWLGTQVSVSNKWMPLLSFAVVFIGVVFLVKIAARLVEKAIQLALLGWVNKIGGILFFALLYTIILSIILFYAKQLNIITSTTIAESKMYTYIEPIGKKVINGIGGVIPLFKDLFTQLESFFEGIKQKA
jgi:membrane protein required for colicin V production